MSSTLHLICLTHDPALLLSHREWRGGRDGNAAAIAAASDAAGDEALTDHGSCDLIVGRFSYPLVEVGCPPRDYKATPRGPHEHRAHHHNQPQWLDIEWLRLLAVAYAAGPGPLAGPAEDACRNNQHCWTAGRLYRIRDFLNLPPASITSLGDAARRDGSLGTCPTCGADPPATAAEPC